jgi:hypothetical protein
MRTTKAITAGLAVLAVTAGSVIAQTSLTRPPFGCFQVSVPQLNIRLKPDGDAPVIGSVKQGDFLIKRKRFCNFRGFFCAVQAGPLEGYADKNFMAVAPCPASTAVPTN